MTKKQFCINGINDAKIPDHILKGRNAKDISWIPAIDEAWTEFKFSLGNPGNMDENFLQNLIAVIIQKYPHFSELDLIGIFKLSTMGELGEVFGSPDKNFYLNAYMKWIKNYGIMRYRYEVDTDREKAGIVRAQDIGELIIYGFKTGKLSRELCYQLHGKFPEQIEMPKKFRDD